jgi:hypothetical protein
LPIRAAQRRDASGEIPRALLCLRHTDRQAIGATRDNIEVGRHATLPLSKEKPHFFLIDLATGGGWPVDLSRYDGVADMYIDYVRVYQGKK